MEFNIDPYHDDFDANAKDNNYVKILFKPGVSVQARELTQIQSILQNQIKSFGDHIFQDGSPVIGGNLTLDNKVSYIKLKETYNNEDIELDQFLDKVIIRESDGAVQAKVLATYYSTGLSPTLLIKYVSGSEFVDSDTIKVAGETTRASCIDSNATGKGTVVSINEGIFYVNGYFVQVNPQTAVVGAYTQNANVKIGLEISEDIIDYVVDSTLLDPAQSSFNYQAPGADRYQFNLNLTTRPLETSVDESSFFELMRVENGAVTKQVRYPIYSEIEKTLARRTFDESGDYTITPFVATVAQSSDDGKYILNLSPGKAYVKGFEFETIGSFKMEVDKPRSAADKKNLYDIDIDTSYGNYLKFKNLRGSTNTFIDIQNLEQVDLHLVNTSSVTIGTTGGAAANSMVYANTKIGTAKIRNIQRDAASSDANIDSDGVYRVYLSDINIKPRIIRLDTSTGSSSTINLTYLASSAERAYENVSITVLPIALTPIANVSTGNVYVNNVRVNANSITYNVKNTLASGDIIRIGDDVRKIVSVNTSGDYLTVNSAFTQTIVGTVSAPMILFKQTDYSSNITSVTRTISAYSGATRVATLDRPFDDNGVAAVNNVVQLNYGIKDVECFIEGTLTNGTTGYANVIANVATQSKLINGDVELFEASKNILIYRLPREYAANDSMINVDYHHTKYFSGISGTSGVFTIDRSSLLNSAESVDWAITTPSIQDNLIAVVRNGSGNAGTYPNGSILQLSSGNITPTGSYGIQITTNNTITALDVYINIKRDNAEGYLRSKTLRKNDTYTTTPFTYPSPSGVTADYTVSVANRGNVAKINVAGGLVFITDPSMTVVDPGDSISLYVPDVLSVKKILMGTYANPAQSGAYTDVTNWFDVDYGQRDTIYDHAKLVLKQGYPTPNAQLTVHCDFYTHDYTAALGASYFSVDSYSDTVYGAGSIPVYYSKSGGVYYLRDCLDFRPTRQIGLSDGTILNGRMSAPDSTTELSYSYFLPRIDKLVLGKNKEFRIIKGESSASPIPPPDADDAMTLYNIYLPPYVASVSDIRLKYIENKRYTMKDISSIDKRVKAIEYYTSLNNIESSALGDPTTYEDGTDKAKYGIIGEGFRNYNIADYKNPDFTVRMERDFMGPAQSNRVSGLKIIGESNVSDNDKSITLSYTEEPAVQQGVTSNKTVSVQPFLFASFIGHVKLTPEIDYWVSETLKPEVVRGPEVTQIIQETTVKEVIREKIIERDPPITLPPPQPTAQTVVTIVPAVDPPVTPTPVIEPDPPPVVKDDVVPPVVSPPLYSGYASTNYPPVFPSVIGYKPYGFAGTSGININGYNLGMPLNYSWPNIDLLYPVMNAATYDYVTPPPVNSTTAYGESSTVQSTPWGTAGLSFAAQKINDALQATGGAWYY